MDAVQFLKREHQKAKLAFRKVLKATPRSRGKLWTKLLPELEVHEQIEDACLYAPLARGAGKTDRKLAGWRRKHRNEVGKVEGLIKQINKLDPEEVPWLAKVRSVHVSLETHIREEERDIFPRIQKVWNEGQRKEAGTDLKQMKTKKLKRAKVR